MAKTINDALISPTAQHFLYRISRYSFAFNHGAVSFERAFKTIELLCDNGRDGFVLVMRLPTLDIRSVADGTDASRPCQEENLDAIDDAEIHNLRQGFCVTSKASSEVSVANRRANMRLTHLCQDAELRDDALAPFPLAALRPPLKYESQKPVLLRATSNVRQ